MKTEEKAWDELLRLDRTDVCSRSLATFDRNTNSYCLRVIDEEYAVKLQDEKAVKISKDGSEIELDRMSRLLILQYLLNSKDVPISGKFRSPFEFKGGELFFSASSHDISCESILQRYSSPQEFLRAGLMLGGNRISFADEAFELSILPRIPIAYLFWVGDQEFASRVSILFDTTAEQHLPIDALWLAILVTNKRLLQKE